MVKFTKEELFTIRKYLIENQSSFYIDNLIDEINDEILDCDTSFQDNTLELEYFKYYDPREAKTKYIKVNNFDSDQSIFEIDYIEVINYHNITFCKEECVDLSTLFVELNEISFHVQPCTEEEYNKVYNYYFKDIEVIVKE